MNALEQVLSVGNEPLKDLTLIHRDFFPNGKYPFQANYELFI